MYKQILINQYEKVYTINFLKIMTNFKMIFLININVLFLLNDFFYTSIYPLFFLPC